VIRGKKGIVSIEQVFATFLFLLLVFGGLEFARAAALKHALGVGAWTAARHLSLNPWDEGVAESLARQAIAGNIMGGDPSAAMVTCTFSDPGRAFGTTVTVRVTMNYQALVPLLNLAPRTMVGESVLLVEAWP